MDFSKILYECGLGNVSAQDVSRKIAGLVEFYSSDEIIEIFNYILNEVNNFEILTAVVQYADNYKSQSTLQILLDHLTKNKNYNENNYDEYVNFKVMCAKAISNYKDTSTLPYLLSCLNNKNENYKIRLACADALGRIGDRYAVAPLIDIVKDDNEKSIYVKESATFALGLLGDTSAIDPLVSILETKQGLWDKFSFLKEKIVEVLGKLNIKNYKVLRALKNSLIDSSPMVRINTIEALMNSEFEEAEELIRKALHDENDEVKKNALIALYNLIGRDILEEVISLPSYSDFLKIEAKNIIREYEEE